MILGGLPHFWYSIHREVTPKQAADRRELEVARRLLTRGPQDFDIARTLYSTNPGWPCQSEKLKGNYVSKPDEIIATFERNAEIDPSLSDLLDEHLVAFSAASYQGLPESVIMGAIRENSADSGIIFTLQLLADVQRVFGPPEAPRLMRWLAGLIEPVIETYHSIETKQSLRASIEQLVPSGNLGRLLHAIDDHSVRQADIEGFQGAQRQYYQLARYWHWLQSGGHVHTSFIRGVARPIAAT